MVTLLLSCTTLSFATPRRFIPTHQKTCKRPQIYKNICKTTPGSLLPQTTEWRVLRNGLRFSSKSCVYKKIRRRTPLYACRYFCHFWRVFLQFRSLQKNPPKREEPRQAIN